MGSLQKYYDILKERNIDTDNDLADFKKISLIQRIAIIATTVIVVICCVVAMVKKQETRNIERQQQETIYQAEYEAQMQRESEEAAQRAEEQRLREIEYQRRRDSIAALPKVETPKPPKPTWSWNDIENMVRNMLSRMVVQLKQLKSDLAALDRKITAQLAQKRMRTTAKKSGKIVISKRPRQSKFSVKSPQW